MNETLAYSLIGLPLVGSPLIYFTGRFGSLRTDLLPIDRRASVARFVSLLVLLAAWVVFGFVAQEFDEHGAASFEEGTIALRIDGVSLIFTALALGLASAVIISSGPYRRLGTRGEEKFYALLVTLTGTMIGMVCAADLFNLWVWFETMVVSSYLLVAFYREQPAPLEASVKYLVQSAIGSVLVLLGISLVLAESGTINIAEIAATVEPSEPLLAAGALFIIGFGIKSALVPLHTWLPDAYTQSPSGVSAILAGVVTSAGFVTLIRALAPLARVSNDWGAILMGFGLLNIVVGNLLAFRQTEVKRLLAYSSLPHIGFIILGAGITVETGDPSGAEGSIFHLFNHGLMKGLAFLAVGALLYGLKRAVGTRGSLTIKEMSGVVTHYPLTSVTFSIAVLGLAGIPPLAGFISLVRIFGAGVETGEAAIQIITIIAAVNELLALGYYLPLMNTVLLGAPSETVERGKRLPFSIQMPLAVLALLVLAIGIWPEALTWLVEPAGEAIAVAFGG